MRKRYGDHNWRELVRLVQTENGLPQLLPRQTLYGSSEAAQIGLVPLGDYPDLLVPVDSFKDVIAECHRLKLFPMYAQNATWAPEGFAWSQNGLNYCWGWGLTAVLLDCRAAEGKPTVPLAPNTFGWMVNWRNNGYYPDRAIQGASQRGVAPQTYVSDLWSINPNTFKAGWEAEALKYRPLEWWDTQKTSTIAMIQQCLTILKTGRSLYVGNDDWSHAYNICGLEWDESELHNLVWIARNSHGEKTFLELTGDFAVPDFAAGIRATIDTE